MNLRILGAHRSDSEDSRCTSLLIDDTLVLDAGGLTSTMTIPAQLGLKAVLLTHHHYAPRSPLSPVTPFACSSSAC